MGDKEYTLSLMFALEGTTTRWQDGSFLSNYVHL